MEHPCKSLANKLSKVYFMINPLNAELNPICHLLTLLEAHHILHVSRLRVKSPPDHVALYSAGSSRAQMAL